MDFKYRARKRLAVPLPRAHKALNRAAKVTASACVEVSTIGYDVLPLDLVSFQHWSIRYLDFGFNARQISRSETEIEVMAVVYLSRFPLARTYFEAVVAQQLKDALYQFSLLSDVMAQETHTDNSGISIDCEDLSLLAA